jgi:hypothetical protein
MLGQMLAEIAEGRAPDFIVSGGGETWSGKAIDRALLEVFPRLSENSLKPDAAAGICLGADALTQVVVALEELRNTDAQRALVASLGWNQQVAAAMIERAPR